MSAKLSSLKRARTDEQKLDRRDAILNAAKDHFREAGFEGFSMGVLARKAGVAKGTLYLYFKTREEVLLTLYNEQLADFCDRMAERLAPGMTDDAFVRLFFDTSREDPLFLALGARLESAIEHNVSIDALVESKRGMIQHIQGLVDQVARALAMEPAQAFELLTGYSALMIGAQQNDCGPALEAEAFPPDVAAFAGHFTAESRFVPNALHILRGVRG